MRHIILFGTYEETLVYPLTLIFRHLLQLSLQCGKKLVEEGTNSS